MLRLEELQQCMDAEEGEHLEFKEAKSNFHFEKLVKYCAALANEGGAARFILGVTDKRPRRVVGSQAFTDLQRTKAGLIESFVCGSRPRRLRTLMAACGCCDSPRRGPSAMPIAVEGAYWMRSGEDLAPMTPDMLRRIFDEAGPDFSAEICPKATLADLDPAAIEDFRHRWREASGNEALATATVASNCWKTQTSSPTEGITYAALILLGKAKSLSKLVAQAEVIFEYRSSEAPGPANQRDEFRQGFLTFFDKLWQTINLRNDKQHYQEGFVMHADRHVSGRFGARSHSERGQPPRLSSSGFGLRPAISAPTGDRQPRRISDRESLPTTSSTSSSPAIGGSPNRCCGAVSSNAPDNSNRSWRSFRPT